MYMTIYSINFNIKTSAIRTVMVFNHKSTYDIHVHDLMQNCTWQGSLPLIIEVKCQVLQDIRKIDEKQEKQELERPPLWKIRTGAIAPVAPLPLHHCTYFYKFTSFSLTSWIVSSLVIWTLLSFLYQLASTFSVKVLSQVVFSDYFTSLQRFAFYTAVCCKDITG